LFASGRDERLARRPTDVALLLLSSFLLVVAGVLAAIGDDFEAASAAALRSLPGIFEPVFRAGYAAIAVWAGFLFVVAGVRRRGRLLRNLAIAAGTAFAVSALASRIIEGRWPDIGAMVGADGPPAFPVLLTALCVAVVSTASPSLARPFRLTGRWLLVWHCFGAVYLGLGRLSHTFGGLAIGLAAAAAVHLVFGSPGGVPTVSRIALALEGIGVEARSLHPAAMASRGVVAYEAEDDDGPLLVKVYGRDAWDAQLLTSLWRLLTYRSANASVVLRRLQQVEHEAFVTLLAERAGVQVEPVVTAGSAGSGDALLVVRRTGKPVGDASARAVDDAMLDAMWSAVRALHDAGITHAQLDPGRVRVHDGDVIVSDFAASSVAATRRDELFDCAQLLVTTALVAGDDRAVAAATAALGAEELREVVPYVQPAALSPDLLARARADDFDLDAFREFVAARCDAPSPVRVRLRRVDRRALVSTALLLVASVTLISGLSGLEWSEVGDAFTTVDWWWVALAVVVAQLARATGALSTMGASTYPLPPGPTTAMQFAISYINLAIPSTAARVAVNVRYLQRVGVPSGAALAVGAVESAAGFVVQIALLLLLPLTSDLDVDLSSQLGEPSGAATVVLVVVGVVLLGGAICLFVPSIRSRVKDLVQSAAGALRVLRSPAKIALLLGANLVGQVLFAAAIGLTLRAFGEHVPLTTLVLINTLVTLFAGIMPVPGGIGVSEAGLVWGLTSVGVDDSVALAVAITYRCASFYLPPVWGYVAYRRLTNEGYL
jgi:uncharacterized membrane protein YbhN (UPF0104 family)